MVYNRFKSLYSGSIFQCESYQYIYICVYIYLGIFVNISLVLVFLLLEKTLTSYRFYYLVGFLALPSLLQQRLRSCNFFVLFLYSFLFCYCIHVLFVKSAIVVSIEKELVLILNVAHNDPFLVQIDPKIAIFSGFTNFFSELQDCNTSY